MLAELATDPPVLHGAGGPDQALANIASKMSLSLRAWQCEPGAGPQTQGGIVFAPCVLTWPRTHACVCGQPIGILGYKLVTLYNLPLPRNPCPCKAQTPARRKIARPTCTSSPRSSLPACVSLCKFCSDPTKARSHTSTEASHLSPPEDSEGAAARPPHASSPPAHAFPPPCPPPPRVTQQSRLFPGRCLPTRTAAVAQGHVRAPFLRQPRAPGPAADRASPFCWSVYQFVRTSACPSMSVCLSSNLCMYHVRMHASI